MAQRAKDRIGRRGERIARRFLRWRRGYRLIESNWRCGLGELDIVALDGRVLVFVEVKTRRADGLAVAEDALTDEKRQRLQGLARAFMGQYHLEPFASRIDVLAIRVRRWPWPAEVTHYKDAV